MRDDETPGGRSRDRDGSDDALLGVLVKVTAGRSSGSGRSGGQQPELASPADRLGPGGGVQLLVHGGDM